MNPFIERKGELAKLHLKKDKIAADIKKIKEDLERKVEALNEVHRNLLNDTEDKIKNFPKLCDHTNEDGSVATGKEHKIMVPSIIGDFTLVKQMCSLCGGTISESKVEVKRPKDGTLVDSEFKTWYQIDEDNDIFTDTLTFDPNFMSNFMGYISGSTLNYINNMINNNE